MLSDHTVIGRYHVSSITSEGIYDAWNQCGSQVWLGPSPLWIMVWCVVACICIRYWWTVCDEYEHARQAWKHHKRSRIRLWVPGIRRYTYGHTVLMFPNCHAWYAHHTERFTVQWTTKDHMDMQWTASGSEWTQYHYSRMMEWLDRHSMEEIQLMVRSILSRYSATACRVVLDALRVRQTVLPDDLDVRAECAALAQDLHMFMFVKLWNASWTETHAPIKHVTCWWAEQHESIWYHQQHRHCQLESVDVISKTTHINGTVSSCAHPYLGHPDIQWFRWSRWLASDNAAIPVHVRTFWLQYIPAGPVQMMYKPQNVNPNTKQQNGQESLSMMHYIKSWRLPTHYRMHVYCQQISLHGSSSMHASLLPLNFVPSAHISPEWVVEFPPRIKDVRNNMTVLTWNMYRINTQHDSPSVTTQWTQWIVDMTKSGNPGSSIVELPTEDDVHTRVRSWLLTTNALRTTYPPPKDIQVQVRYEPERSYESAVDILGKVYDDRYACLVQPSSGAMFVTPRWALAHQQGGSMQRHHPRMYDTMFFKV